ncbi:ABC transporter permease [candidate division KSB1 bacterium]|nr:ABC transporter permease [candidate division KSB1 bacterium]
MATAITIYTWAHNELNYDKFHRDIDRLYRVAFYVKDNLQFANTFHGEWLSGRLADYLRDEYPEIKAATILGNVGLKLSFQENNFYSHGQFVHPDFFSMFNFPVLDGDPNRILNEGVCMVITKDLATKLFGDQEPAGQIVKIDDQHDVTVSGVVDNPPRNSSIQFEFLLPYRLSPPYMRMWNNKAVQVFVLLDDKADDRDVSSKIENAYNIHNPNDLPNYLYLQPMHEMRLHDLDGEGGRITFIYIFSVMGIFVLIIACINYINLATARSSVRAREIGIKKVMGSKRSQLIVQFLGESLFSCLISFVFSLFLTELWLPIINRLLHVRLQLDLSPATLFVLVGIILFTGIIGGLYPAFFLSSFRVITTLKGDSINSARGPLWARKILVIAQFTLSIIFIIGLTVIFSQLYYCKNKYMGYDKENIVVLPLNGEAGQKQVQIKNELLRHSKILNATITTGGLAGWSSSAGLDWNGKRPDQIFDVGVNRVDYDFLQTFKMEMRQGRFFSREFSTDLSDACVLNETAVRAMEMENPIGKQVIWCKGTDFEQTATIIGVLKDYHTESFHTDIRPYILFPIERGNRLNVKIASTGVRQTLNDIRRIIKEIAPNYTFSVHFVDDEILGQYQTEILTRVIVFYVAIIAIFITILGLIGLVAFSAERRTQEIGIRKTLGATQQQIVLLLSKEFTSLVIIANLFAWPLAWYISSRWLQNFAFHISLEWWIFAVAAIVTIGLTLLTVSSHALRAASANPVEALRYE